MSSIVAGRFETLPDAERAARELYMRGFSVWDVSIFSVGGDAGTERASRPAGVLLSARAEGELTAQAADILRGAGARDLERAEGRWEDGRWADFNPGARPVPMEPGAHAREGGPTAGGAPGEPAAAAPGQAYDSAARGTTGPDNERSGQLGAASVAFNETGNEDPGAEIDQAVGQRSEQPVAPSSPPASVQGEDNTVEPGKNDDATKGAQRGQAEQGTGSRREDWEQAASYRPPEERDSSPELVRGATTTPEPQDEKDIDRKVRRGESPPGVGEQQLRDPGNATPGAPPVDNRS
jgi:hypothetical protein